MKIIVLMKQVANKDAVLRIAGDEKWINETDVAAGTAVKPGVWKYAIRMNADGASRDVGTRTVTVASSTYNGSPAWLVTEVQQTPNMTATDSVYVAKSNLAAVHRVARFSGDQGDGAMIMRFGRDSVRGSIAAGGQNAPLALPQRAGSAATWAVVELALRAVPVSANWRGTADVVAQVPSGFLPVELAVTGRETVKVPAGSFDSWVVRMQSGSSVQTHYLSPSGTIVRSVMTPPQMPSGNIETVLISGPTGR